jgi:hypothetical protein
MGSLKHGSSKEKGDAHMSLICQVGITKFPVESEEECHKLGGTIVSDGGDCFVRDILVRELAENILWLGTTYEIAVTFRERLLKTCPVGKRMLSHYYAHLDELFAIVREDPEILTIALNAWKGVIPFAVAMLQTEDLDTESLALESGTLRLNKSVCEFLGKLCDRFLSASRNEPFRSAIEDFRIELKLYEESTAKAAVQTLRRKK